MRIHHLHYISYIEHCKECAGTYYGPWPCAKEVESGNDRQYYQRCIHDDFYYREGAAAYTCNCNLDSSPGIVTEPHLISIDTAHPRIVAPKNWAIICDDSAS